MEIFRFCFLGRKKEKQQTDRLETRTGTNNDQYQRRISDSLNKMIQNDTSNMENFEINNFDQLKQFFDRQFQLNEEIQNKYNKNKIEGLDDLSVKNDLSQYQSFDMGNSQLKKIEEFEQMTQSNRKRQYINAKFLTDSNDQVQIKYDIFNKDINMMSDEEIMKIIISNQVVEMTIQKPYERKNKFKRMLQNIKLLNNQHYEVIDSQKFDTNTQYGLIYKDDKNNNYQRNITYYLLKQIGVTIFSQKNLVQISYPINIYQSETILTRIAKQFIYAPVYLPANQKQKPLTIFKKVVAFFFSGLYLQITQQIPLLPVYGETHSCYLVNDQNTVVQFFSEQISYNPPISQINVQRSIYCIY